MKVLIADKFEQSGIDGLTAAALLSALRTGSEDILDLHVVRIQETP